MFDVYGVCDANSMGEVKEGMDSESRRWGLGEHFGDLVMESMAVSDEAVNLTSELHDPNAQVNHLRKKEERKRPSREHRCGAGQIPSEG